MRASLDVLVDIVVSVLAWCATTKLVLSVRRRLQARLSCLGIALGREHPPGWLWRYARVGSLVVLVQAVGVIVLYAGFIVVLAVLQILINGPSWAETLGIALLGLAVAGSFLVVITREVLARVRAIRAMR